MQDIEIWENKRYVDRPRLCRDDGPVFRFRRWYRQFLPDDPTVEHLPDAQPRREPRTAGEQR